MLAHGERGVEALARAGGLGITTTSAHLQTLVAGSPNVSPNVSDVPPTSPNVLKRRILLVEGWSRVA